MKGLTVFIEAIGQNNEGFKQILLFKRAAICKWLEVSKNF